MLLPDSRLQWTPDEIGDTHDGRPSPGNRHVTILFPHGGSSLPPRPTLKKSLRAIERANADIVTPRAPHASGQPVVA